MSYHIKYNYPKKKLMLESRILNYNAKDVQLNSFNPSKNDFLLNNM
jgi:hypothetical protein